MNDHPGYSELESFLGGSPSREVARRVVRHLLADCSSCRALLTAMGWGKERLERLVSLLASEPEDVRTLVPEGGFDYDESFTRTWYACMRELAMPSPQAIPAGLDDEFDAVELEEPPAGAEDLVPEARLVIALLDRSHAARYQDSKKMLYWARVARLLAERCDEKEAGGADSLADLRARAWGQVGNALRVVGRLRDAEWALSTAQRYAAAGSGDKALRLELLSWQASLTTFERQFDRALYLLDEACAIARESEDRAALTRCLVNKAIVAVYSGEAEAAIAILDDAIPLIDPTDLHLLFAAFNNLSYCYLEADRLQEALAVLPQSRDLAHQIGDELLVLRVLWQEAKILCNLGLLEEAEALFSRARDGFVARDLAYEAAVVSLDVTAIYLKLGLAAEVRRTVADILPIFSGLGVRSELLASLIQLQQAEDQAKALHLIRTLSRELSAGPKLPSTI